MALIKCRECGKEISENAKKCPNCGVSLNRKNDKTILIVIVSIIVILIFIFLIFGKTNRLKQGFWYHDEDGTRIYKFENGKVYYYFDRIGKTTEIGSYEITGNKLLISENKAFDAQYECNIISSTDIKCNGETYTTKTKY